MRTLVMALTASLILTAPAMLAQTITSPRPAATAGSSRSPGRPPGPATLAGTWTAEPFELTLTSDFDTSVWGANATSVRTVALVVKASGDATLTVTRKVVDARRRTVAGSTSVEEAQIRVGMPHAAIGVRIDYDVTVLKAERRYPDDREYRWTIEGLQVRVTGFDQSDDTLEVRVDPPDGRDSFWATLHRAGRTAPKRTAG